MKPMDLAFRLLKNIPFEDGGYRSTTSEDMTMEDAFDMGSGFIPYDELHSKQRQVVDAILSSPKSYWNDPASGEFEAENYAGMFHPETQHLYSDEAFDQYLRYLQHYFAASAETDKLPHEKQMEIMLFDGVHPQHPSEIAELRMAQEYGEDWGSPTPHDDFYFRYNPETQTPTGPIATAGKRSLASRMARQNFLLRSEDAPFDMAFRLLKYTDEYNIKRNLLRDLMAQKYRERMVAEGTPEKAWATMAGPPMYSDVGLGGGDESWGAMPKRFDLKRWQRDYGHLLPEETIRQYADPSYRGPFVTPREMGTIPFDAPEWAELREKLGPAPVETGEPMDIAMRLLKLELAPPMTQGVEEQVPMQEDIPMVDMTMGDYESPCECAERIRSAVLSMILQEIEKPNKRSQSDIDYFREQYQDWQGHECQEILQWAETTNGFNPSHYCNNNYMSEADQMKYTGEPMDIAMRLLKDYRFIGNHSDKYYKTLLQRMKTAKEKRDTLEHIGTGDPDHYYKRKKERFNEQKMPRGFGQFTPEEVSLFMANDVLSNHPELIEQLNTLVPAPDPNLPHKTPSMQMQVFDTTDPVVSEEFGIQRKFSPVLAVGDDGKIGLKTVTGDKSVAGNRKTIHVGPETHDFSVRETPIEPEVEQARPSPVASPPSPPPQPEVDDDLPEGMPPLPPAIPPGFKQQMIDQWLSENTVQTGEPMDLAFRLLKGDDDFMRDYFYQTARNAGIPEEEINRAWEKSQHWEPPIPPGDPNNLHPGDEGEGVEGGRRYFPTQLKHRDASPGVKRSVQHDDHDIGTFRDTPFNESTYFTTGEPMDLAFRLLKDFYFGGASPQNMESGVFRPTWLPEGAAENRNLNPNLVQNQPNYFGANLSQQTQEEDPSKRRSAYQDEEGNWLSDEEIAQKLMGTLGHEQLHYTQDPALREAYGMGEDPLQSEQFGNFMPAHEYGAISSTTPDMTQSALDYAAHPQLNYDPAKEMAASERYMNLATSQMPANITQGMRSQLNALRQQGLTDEQIQQMISQGMMPTDINQQMQQQQMQQQQQMMQQPQMIQAGEPMDLAWRMLKQV